MSKTKKNNQSPDGPSSTSSRSCSSPSPSSATFTTTTSASSAASTCSAESMRLIHNNLHNNPHQQFSINDHKNCQQLSTRMTTVRRLLTIAFLLLLICAVSLFSLHQILQILAHEQQTAQLNKNTGQLSPPLEAQQKSSQINQPPPPPPLPLSKAEPLLYRALLQKTTALSTLEQKRSFIRTMAREAWTAYTRLAWGHEALRPLTSEPYDSEDWWYSPAKNTTTSKPNLSGRTIVSSASTLWLMGLKHEYEQARNWIATQLDPQTVTTKMSLYFTIGEILGGLLSCYALSGDLLFLDKAVSTASALKPAYAAPKGLLYKEILTQNQTKSPEQYNNFLWIASQNLEYLYLLELTGACEYGRRVAEMRAHIWELLESSNPPNNLETNYLLHFAKTFKQSAGDDYEAFRFYNRSLARLKSAVRRSRTGLLYVRELNYHENFKKESDWMDSDSCCLASLVALGSKLKNGTLLDRDLNLAVALAETCHQAARRTAASGLSPARFYFDERDDATNQYGDVAYRFNILGPELAEAYFLLYRLTRNTKYQTYAWELAQALQRYCRTESGAYSVVASVEQVPPEMLEKEGSEEVQNRQPSYFIGATLKYLYLTFSDEEGVLPLEQWTFNALGQPLPIRRTKVGNRCAKKR